MIAYKTDLTCSHNTENLSQERPTAPLQADYQAFLKAPVASVFEAVAHHKGYCRLFPNLKQVSVYPSEQGLIRACDFGNDMILKERIVFWQPPAIYAYTAVAPNPFGVWQHYAVVYCEPAEGGTQLRWQHYFDHDDLEVMLSMLNKMFDQVFAELFTQFDGYMLR